MKRIIIGVAIAACTFICGVIIVAVRLSKSAPDLSLVPSVSREVEIAEPPLIQSTIDSTADSVKFCRLVRDSNRYDGKVVRVQATYIQGADTSSLTDSACDTWVRLSCARPDEACGKMWKQIVQALQSGRSYMARVDVVGKYTADIKDPDPNQGGVHVRYFEMLELKGVEPMKAPSK